MSLILLRIAESLVEKGAGRYIKLQQKGTGRYINLKKKGAGRYMCD